jgi:hypothetical protein
MLRRCVVCHTSYPGTERFCPLDGGAIVEDTPGETGTRVGQTIDGRYLVRRLIGRGGMGEVYQADHVGLDKQVAIKFVTSDNTNPNALARFRREARVASKIVHEHVVQIFDVGSDRGVDYIAMEYLEGRDLKQALAEEGALSVARGVSIARQMLAGLAAIHDADILHRDIKPANVLLTKRGEDTDFVKIMDFGISRAAKGTEDGLTLTGTGNVIGTPDYIAPEVLRAGPIDHRADLYAVGITLHAMLAGKPPFVATAFERIVAMHLSEPPPRLQGVPAHVADAVIKSLAKEPGDRFADARAFAKALEAPRAQAVLVEDSADRARPVDVTARDGEQVIPRRGAPVGLIAAIAAVVVIGGGLAAWFALHDTKAGAVDAAAVTAIADAAKPIDEVLALAATKEHDNPALAIALYTDAFARAPTADIAEKLGDLSVALEHRPEAIEYYQKYLELAPADAAHRAAVTTHLALLTAPPIDAPSSVDDAVPVGDGGAVAAVLDAAPVVIDEHTPFCRCDDGVGTLCAPPGQPYCMCFDRVDPLCPTEMQPHDACGANPKFANYAVMPGHKTNEACTGYAHFGGIEHHGALDCKQCDPQAYVFRGQSGDVCNGIGATDGVKGTGHLICKPAP